MTHAGRLLQVAETKLDYRCRGEKLRLQVEVKTNASARRNYTKVYDLPIMAGAAMQMVPMGRRQSLRNSALPVAATRHWKGGLSYLRGWRRAAVTPCVSNIVLQLLRLQAVPLCSIR